MNRIEGGFRKAINVPLAGLLALSMGAAACGDNTSETTPPPITPITIETTIPPTTLPPTTTEAPTTTTTTVPETTTTTEAEYPFNLPSSITMATGEIKDLETEEKIDLGFIEFQSTTFTFARSENSKSITIDYQEAVITGRITRAYSKTEENPFHEDLLSEYVYFDAVVGKFTNGNPVLVTFKVGNTIKPLSINEIVNNESFSFQANASDFISEDSNIGRKIQNGINRYAQIQFKIPLFGDVHNIIINDLGFSLPGETLEEYQKFINNVFEGYETNQKLVDLLIQGNIDPNEWSFNEGLIITNPNSFLLFNINS